MSNGSEFLSCKDVRHAVGTAWAHVCTPSRRDLIKHSIGKPKSCRVACDCCVHIKLFGCPDPGDSNAAWTPNTRFCCPISIVNTNRRLLTPQGSAVQTSAEASRGKVRFCRGTWRVKIVPTTLKDHILTKSHLSVLHFLFL